MTTVLTASAQGGAGLALVMGFGLLCIRQTSAASILLAIQSVAVALAAVAMHQPIMAVPPVILATGIWFARLRTTMLKTWTMPAGGAKLGVGAGAVLAVLCQSQGSLAMPLAVVLLSVLLAATRTHPLMRVMALVAVQNGILLAACLVIQPAFLPPWLLPLACLVLPLPLAAFLLIPAVPSRGIRGRPWLGWIDLSLSLAVLAATFIAPLDPLASVFAPLLGLDGVLRSEVRRRRQGVATPSIGATSPPSLPGQEGGVGLAPPSTRFAHTIAGRGLALLNSVVLVLAVCAPNPMMAWLALPAAVATALLPTRGRHWDQAVLASLGTAMVLFGLMLISATPSVVGYFSLFAGFAAIATVVPDLAVVSVILILRLATLAPWPPVAEALGVGIALAALLGCAFMLIREGLMRDRATLLLLCQASIAALSICMGGTDGRFAALVLLILIILSRSAARLRHGPIAGLALAGLGGVPPLGVFPGLVLVVLAMSRHDPWLLLPVVLAAIPVLLAAVPRRLPDTWSIAAIRSIVWVPLVLAVLVGYFVPDGLSHWWHFITAGRS